MTDKELIEKIRAYKRILDTRKEQIDGLQKEIGMIEGVLQTLVNELMLRMEDREKPKKIFCCFRRSKG